MSSSTYAAWHNRGAALFSVIDHQLCTMNKEKEAFARKNTLIALLTALRAFGESQLAFFINGFDPMNSAIRLEPSTEYPPEYAMRATVDQIAYDLDVIQRAYQQRLPSQSSQEMRTLLDKADYLAYRALKPAIDRGLIDDVTVVTYFQKAVNVRIIPYAPVAFIGLPLSALAMPQDLLAIPHEVGHYVFRHGCTQQGTSAGSRFEAALHRQFDQLPQWTLDWLEEIFADVYGALIGGPVMALGFEDLITDDPYIKFVEDDGEHPVAALRPAIYHSVLRKQGNYDREVAMLSTRWAEWYTKYGDPSSFTPHESDETVPLQQAQEQINQIIDTLLGADLANLQAETGLWSGKLNDNDAIDTLFAYFADKVNALEVNTQALAPELDLSPRAASRALGAPTEEVLELYLRPLRRTADSGPVPVHDMGGNAATQARRVGDTGQWFDVLKVDGATFNIPPTVWMALLDGSGWATEGPGLNAH